MARISLLDIRRWAKAEYLIKKRSDPGWLGERYGEIRSLEIWEWAESKGLTKIQAGIAAVTTVDLIMRYRGKGMKEWSQKLLDLARKAKSDDQLEEYTGFIEGVLPTATLERTQRAALEQELYETYLQLNNWAYAIWHACNLATHYMHSGDLKKAGDLFKSAYESSRLHGYHKGIIRAFIGLGNLVSTKNPVLACRFLYHAKQLSAKERSKWGIPASEKLREIQHDHAVRSSDFELKISPDRLITEFEATINEDRSSNKVKSA